MRLHTLVLASIIPAASLLSTSQAAIVAFTQRSVWDLYTSSNGASRATEDFNGLSGTFTPALAGSRGGVDWLASAPGGIEVGSAGGTPALSTVDPAALTLRFSGAPVRGIGANVFGIDDAFSVVPVVVRISLFDGTTIVRTMTSTSSFVGVWSTGADITSVEILPLPADGSSTTLFATVDNLTFAVVPAPAAGLVLVAAAAMPRRRRA